MPNHAANPTTKPNEIHVDEEIETTILKGSYHAKVDHRFETHADRWFVFTNPEVFSFGGS